MNRYRRRTFEVRARQFTFEERREITDWVHGRLHEQMSLDRGTGDGTYRATLAFLDHDGTMQSAVLGQWIVVLDSGAVRVLNDAAFHREFEDVDAVLIMQGRRED